MNAHVNNSEMPWNCPKFTEAVENLLKPPLPIAKQSAGKPGLPAELGLAQPAVTPSGYLLPPIELLSRPSPALRRHTRTSLIGGSMKDFKRER
jgi:hypothetical protein